MHLSEEFRKNLPWSLAWSDNLRPVWVFLYHRALALGWCWPFMFTVGAAFFTVFDGPDPLMWRSFGDSDPLMIQMHEINGTWAGFSNHHFLNLMSVAVFCYVIALYFAANSDKSASFLKRYYRVGIIATFAAIWVWSVHEGEWWLTYIVASPIFYHVAVKPTWFSGFGEIFSVSLILITAGLGLFFPWRYTALMGGFYLVWFAVGFPITESYVGNTIYYTQPFASAWEFGSWAFACIVFFKFEAKRLLDWFNGVKKITLRSQVY